MIRKNDRVIYLFSYKGEQIKITGTIQKVYKHSSGVWKAKMIADGEQPLKECDAPVNEFEEVKNEIRRRDS